MDWFLYDNGLRHERVKYFMNNFGMLLSLHINPSSNDNLRHLEHLVLKFTNHLSIMSL